MRTNIVIDDRLMNRAISASGLKTKKNVVEEALRMLILVKDQQGIKKFKGKLRWNGNLDAMRKN